MSIQPKPQRPRAPRERLASIKNPNPTPISSKSVPPRSGKNARPQHKSARFTCPNPSCPAPNIVDDDDKRVCEGCGTVISDSNIVSEVTFGESSAGAAVVQGQHVGADQAYAKSMGPAFKKAGGMESREITDMAGKRYIGQLAAALTIPQSISDAGNQIFKLAVANNFIQGRRTRSVAAVCLYIACRRQESNQHMLIDFSDVLMLNVFKLGQTYKALLEELRLGGSNFLINPINPEDLIYRFAKQLEFGELTMRVANEAAHIVQRMNRDWMTTGRRPAGICGAALILAARMNNFRRTVREVVYVVKVTDLTIHKRLDEFKVTESSDLTVEEFRTIDLEKAHDPPAFYEARNPKSKRKGKRVRQLGDEEPEVISDEHGAGRPQSSTPSTAQGTGRVDADGFAIPAVPIDPALLAASAEALSELAAQPSPTAQPPPPQDETDEPPAKRPRVQPKRQPPPPQTATDLRQESEIESDISEWLNDPSTQAHAAAHSKSLEHAKTVAFTQRLDRHVPDAAEIAPEEFADDPEVSNCLLTPAEVEVKERIWVHENGDYLREQQAKMLKKRLEEENGTARVIVRRKRKKGKMGDLSRYARDGGEGGEGRISGASTPAEATIMMMKERGFSKKINYAMINSLFQRSGSSGGGSSVAGSDVGGDGARGSQEPSPAPGVLAAAGKPLPLQGAKSSGEGEEEDEDDEDEEEEEEDDGEDGDVDEDELSAVTNAVETGLQSAIDNGDVYDV